MGKLHDIFIDHYGEVLLAPNAEVMEQAIKALAVLLADEARIRNTLSSGEDGLVSLAKLLKGIEAL